MYESFYGLREKPFQLTPDPDFFFMSRSHEDAFQHLQYAMAENQGFVVITGEIGAGKTTLINYLLRNMPQDALSGIVNHTSVNTTEFLRMVCDGFGLPANGLDKAGMLTTLRRFLLEQVSQARRVVLIVDEAQNLRPEIIEEIRMLSNLASDKEHLIAIVLSGQPELRSILQRKELAQFAQRVTVYCHLEGLGQHEIGKYIRRRMEVAGLRNSEIFNNGAIETIYEHSKGIPRVVNTLCDAALVHGFADQRKSIDGGVIAEVVRDREEFGLLPSSPSPGSGSESNDLAARLGRLEQRQAELASLVRAAVANQDRKAESFRALLVERIKAALLKERERTDKRLIAHRLHSRQSSSSKPILTRSGLGRWNRKRKR